MKSIILPTSMEHSPKIAYYDIILKSNNSIPNAYIIVKSDFLLNNDFSRNIFLNRILKNELSGIRFDFIKFISIVNHNNEFKKYFSVDYKIFLNWDDIKKKRPDLVKTEGFINKKEFISYTSYDFFCGDILAETKAEYPSEDNIVLPDEELKAIVSGTPLENELFGDQ